MNVVQSSILGLVSSGTIDLGDLTDHFVMHKMPEDVSTRIRNSARIRDRGDGLHACQ